MPAELETAARLVGAVSTVMSGVLGWVYFKRYAVDRAQQRLSKTLTDENSSLRRQLGDLRGEIQGEMRKLELALDGKADCERELLKTKEALAEWETVLGRIWVEDGGPK